MNTVVKLATLPLRDFRQKFKNVKFWLKDVGDSALG